jgi:hypothetical protein
MLSIYKQNKIVRNSRLFMLTLLLSVACMGNRLAYAQEISATASMDTSRIVIGDQAKISLTIDMKRGYEITWPVVDSLVKNIEILRRSTIDTLSSTAGRMKLRQQFQITSFDSGRYTIPGFRIPFHNAAQTDTLSTLPLTIEVLTLPIDSAKGLFDIKKPYGAPLTLKEALPYIGLGLTGILLLAVMVYVIRKVRRHQPLIAQKSYTEPAHIIALRELDRLKEEKLWQQGLTKEYYTRLTEIVRAYIEARYQIPALEQTSDEIMESVKFIGFEEENTLHALSELLSLADLVKFAKALPMPGENENNILHAYMFVHNTKQELLNSKENQFQPENTVTDNAERK